MVDDVPTPVGLPQKWPSPTGIPVAKDDDDGDFLGQLKNLGSKTMRQDEKKITDGGGGRSRNR